MKMDTARQRQDETWACLKLRHKSWENFDGCKKQAKVPSTSFSVQWTKDQKPLCLKPYAAIRRKPKRNLLLPAKVGFIVLDAGVNGLILLSSETDKDATVTFRPRSLDC